MRPGKSKLLLKGTVFQKRVWTELLTIPSGTVASYKQIARRIGRPGAARAVANAIAANPLPAVIPCHRVIRSDGKLGGYSGTGGVKRKKELLDTEREQLKRGGG